MGDVILGVTCVGCSEHFRISAPAEGYIAWSNGAMIQDALPEVSVDDRELLLSKMCAVCWDEMAGV